MNDYDRDNIKFLLTADEETMRDFLEQSDDEDIQYAIELIQRYKTELMIAELAAEDEFFAIEDLDLSEASAVLQRFRL